MNYRKLGDYSVLSTFFTRHHNSDYMNGAEKAILKNRFFGRKFHSKTLKNDQIEAVGPNFLKHCIRIISSVPIVNTVHDQLEIAIFHVTFAFFVTVIVNSGVIEN